MEKMIKPELREEIQLKLDKINKNPVYYDTRKTLVLEDLRTIGDVYSFWIENPELRKSLLLENKQIETIKKQAADGIHAVKNGWYYLSRIGGYGQFVKELDRNILERLNGIIDPKASGTGGLRDKDVTLNILGYTPPSWERVPEKVQEFITRTKEIYKEDTLEAAIFAHLNIAAIQPFLAGNKRCARLIQDRIIYDAGMPPAIIPAGEGKFYFDLLARTLPSYLEGDKGGLGQFYDYCASKVNNGLDDILDDIFEVSSRANNLKS